MHKTASPCTGEIKQTNVPLVNDLPGFFERVQRNAQLHRKDIHRAHGKNAERHTGHLPGSNSLLTDIPGNPVDHFVDGSITSSRDDCCIALLNRRAGNLLSISRHGAQTDLHTSAQSGKTVGQTRRFIALRGWIQNDDLLIHTSQLSWDT